MGPRQNAKTTKKIKDTHQIEIESASGYPNRVSFGLIPWPYGVLVDPSNHVGQELSLEANRIVE